MNKQKTKLQRKTEIWVDNYITVHGIVPSYQEVADYFEISKTAAYERLRWYRNIMRNK